MISEPPSLTSNCQTHQASVLCICLSGISSCRDTMAASPPSGLSRISTSRDKKERKNGRKLAADASPVISFSLFLFYLGTEAAALVPRMYLATGHGKYALSRCRDFGESLGTPTQLSAKFFCRKRSGELFAFNSLTCANFG